MKEEKPQIAYQPTITVSGVTFSADQVKSATIRIDERDIYIGEQEKEKKIGFQSED